MYTSLRKNEISVLIYRLLLVYFFYFIARVIFYFFNADLFEIDSVYSFFKICFFGLQFDTSAMLYVNVLFIVMSIFPILVNTSKTYQKILLYIYFLTNIPFYSLNFIDLIYYPYNYSRTTIAVFDVISNENNKLSMFFRFFISYWYVFLLFISLSFLWYFLYKKYEVKNSTPTNKLTYFIYSFCLLLFTSGFTIIGIRGGYAKSSRPINLVDANRYVEKSQDADLVLNTPFAFLRTLGVKTFKKQDFNLSDKQIYNITNPVKQYFNDSVNKPNVVLIITESFGREYLGAFNKDKNVKGFQGFSPFIDSLSQESLIFTNAYANGYKSIHGMSSVLAGIPSYKDAFTSSPYAKQKIQSLVSCLKEMDYDTSFFHGAPNGSMGFLGFGNILGFDHYYGMTEYNNDSDFDGSWGIWDEPFLKYMKRELDKKEKPFFSTVFTLSSHEPYKVPLQYEGKFPKGHVPIHQCIGYTDNAFREFFKEAKKSKWYNNTIFIITADHCNNVYFKDEYYHKVLNRVAVPILIFSPKENYKGVREDLAQHIDLYPTILDAVGYNKKFRSWGRSLLANKVDEQPYLLNYIAGTYFFAKDDFFCTFDGMNITGLYSKEDKKMHKDLKSVFPNVKYDFELSCKAYLQSYFNSIIDKKIDKPYLIN